MRILRPTRLTAEQSLIARTRHSFSRSLNNARLVSSSSEPSALSIDTVTLVSDVDTRSTDTECSLKIANALARKPTSCHIPTPSIEINVSPLRRQMPLTWGSISSVTDDTTVPDTSGDAVQRIKSGMPLARSGDKHRGCSTELPADESSWASLKCSASSKRADGTTRGSAVNMPGTSVQISRRLACKRAAK